MAAGYPSHSNVFIPSHEASGGLTIGFSRNPKKFKLNQYIKMVPVEKDVGYYLNITAEEAGRIINTNGSDFVWADGQKAPMGDDNLESFTYNTYRCQRYVFPFTLGAKTVAQADWKVLEVHAEIAAQKAMTYRTQNVWNQLTTSGNWSGNTSSATSLVGGYLDTSTTLTLYIKKLFRQVSENILQATLGVVQREDLIAVMNPHTAGLISESPELVDHFKNNQFALQQVRQDAPNQNGQWGLPDVLYGIKIVVEDAVKVTTKKLASSTTRGYVCPAQTIVFMSRPGGLMGSQAIGSFSTAQVFMYSEFEVESRYDANDRLHEARVVEDYATNVVAPAAGYYVTGATSS